MVGFKQSNMILSVKSLFLQFNVSIVSLETFCSVFSLWAFSELHCYTNLYFPDQFLINSYYLNHKEEALFFAVKCTKLPYRSLFDCKASCLIIPRHHRSLLNDRLIDPSWTPKRSCFTATCQGQYKCQNSLLFYLLCQSAQKNQNDQTSKSQVRVILCWILSSKLSSWHSNRPRIDYYCLSLIIWLYTLRVILVKRFKFIINKQMESLLNQTYPVSIAEHFSWEDMFVLKIQGQNQEDSWLNNYQRGQIMDDFYGKQYQVQSRLQCPKDIKATEDKEQPETPCVLNRKEKNKSLFHNFQKNLICLLKKVINIKRKELVALPYGFGAYNLWKWFRDESLSCKKSLYITFGVKAKEDQDLLREVASLNPEIQKMINHYGMESFEQCQSLLRETVHRLASGLKEDMLKKITKVKDFPSFYNYFLIFIDELSKGAISQRMNRIKTKHLRSFQMI